MIPLPDFNTTVVHGGAGDDILVDHSNLISETGNTGSYVHSTYLYGYAGHDSFMAESGSGPNGDYGGPDLFDGGSGVDTVFYSQVANAGMVVDLAYDAAYGRAYAIGYPTDIHQYFSRVDYLVSIEDVYGTQLGDLLYGSAAANLLAGMDGNDTIDGRGGNDALHGGVDRHVRKIVGRAGKSVQRSGGTP